MPYAIGRLGRVLVVEKQRYSMSKGKICSKFKHDRFTPAVNYQTNSLLQQLM